MTKELVKLRLDTDVLAALRASGEGWQTRINETLRVSLRLAGLVPVCLSGRLSVCPLIQTLRQTLAVSRVYLAPLAIPIRPTAAASVSTARWLYLAVLLESLCPRMRPTV